MGGVYSLRINDLTQSTLEKTTNKTEKNIYYICYRFYITLNVPLKVHIRLLILPVAKLSTRHLSVPVCPAIITHRPPLTMVKNFKTSFVAHSTSHQPDSTV